MTLSRMTFPTLLRSFGKPRPLPPVDPDSRQQQLLDHLPGAAGRGELTLVYQPQFRASCGRLAAFEALLRWTSPHLGSVPPVEFIALAEAHGLIGDLGGWVIGEVCRQQGAWLDQGLDQVLVAANISPLQLAQPGFVDEVCATVQQYGLTAQSLELEITERGSVLDVDALLSPLSQLREAGLRVALDDFGAGRTALRDLLSFPLHTVKIDRSLIGRVSHQPGAARIVEAVVALAHAMNLCVVAEGIETRAQLDLMSELDCERVQGYFLGRPESAAAAQARLQAPRQIRGAWGLRT
jgi:diguanylate cyclase